jgi:release factor glutamine methyltransferase
MLVSRLRAAGCVFAEDEAALLMSAARTASELEALVDRRAAGEPLEHILGWAEFCGLRVAVATGVFVPRRRTEFLVGQAAGLGRQAAGLGRQAAGLGRQAAGLGRHRPASGGRPARRPPVVVDLCCGSGAVGAALVASLGQAELHVVDVDARAVRCARRNVAPAGGQVYAGNLYEPLPASLQGHVDVLVANAPYVPSAAVQLLPPEARSHEPWAALDGGPDGLGVQRKVIEAAPLWLAPGRSLLVETSAGQAAKTVEAVVHSGLLPRVARSTELDATVVIGTRP